MITIKAFDKGLVCKGFQYEVGKTYTMPTKQVKICESGFHAATNGDISNTIYYYPEILNTEYALVDINVVDSQKDKVVGDKITILKKITDIDELISYDRTGKWIIKYAVLIQNINPRLIPLLQQAIIKKDQTGEWVTKFAKKVERSDIPLLQEEVIKKDKTGEWVTRFAEFIKDADKERLQQAVIEKDQTGKWVTQFAFWVDEADKEKLQRAVIEKDQTGKWCYEFARCIKSSDKIALYRAIMDKDKTGEWLIEFAIHVDVDKSQLAEIKRLVRNKFT